MSDFTIFREILLLRSLPKYRAKQKNGIFFYENRKIKPKLLSFSRKLIPAKHNFCQFRLQKLIRLNFSIFQVIYQFQMYWNIWDFYKDLSKYLKKYINRWFQSADSLEMSLIAILAPAVRCYWALSHWHEAILTTVNASNHFLLAEITLAYFLFGPFLPSPNRSGYTFLQKNIRIHYTRGVFVKNQGVWKVMSRLQMMKFLHYLTLWDKKDNKLTLWSPITFNLFQNDFLIMDPRNLSVCIKKLI